MIRTFQIAFVACMTFCLIGCKAPEQTDPTLEQIKIADIAPDRKGKMAPTPMDIGVGAESIKTINFDVYIYEMPAESISQLDALWQALDTKPLRFNSYKAFKGNLFRVGLGRIQMASRIHDLLGAAGGQKMLTVSLLLPPDQTNDLTVVELGRKQTVSYISANRTKEGTAIGPGIIALRVKAERIPESRGACKFVAYPVFTVPLAAPTPELAARRKAREFVFAFAAFGLRMSRGDFVVL